jgi:hypothetical protein
MTAPRKKPKQHAQSGQLGDAGLRIGVQELGDWEEPIPDREPQPPRPLATRTPAECRHLAERQRAGEELGLSDAFVSEWAPARPPGTATDS